MKASVTAKFLAPAMLLAGQAALAQDPKTLDDHLRLREALDKKVWSHEVEAQKHEAVFVHLWDEIRNATAKFPVLGDLNFQQLFIGKVGEPTKLENGLTLNTISPPAKTTVPLDHSKFLGELQKLRSQGWKLQETEWHHSKFIPASEGQAAKSQISFVLHCERLQEKERVSLRGKLQVTWKGKKDTFGEPELDIISVAECRIMKHQGKTAFREILSFNPAERPRPGPQRIHPLIVKDLDKDGQSEIILGGVNEVLWPQRDDKGNITGFQVKPFLKDWHGEIGESGVLADFTGDGIADFVAPTTKGLVPMIFEGDQNGLFSKPGRVAANIPRLAIPSVLTAGDIDGDGDLDLWLTQYRGAYSGGQMPTPYYDANDGHPSYLLVNDGKGNFTDHTKEAGLAERRLRRTYASSLVDLDGDHDLDLLVVSDFSGADLYENDGKGNFTDVRDAWLGEWHNFGMGHVLDDFNGDGKLDFYVIGMSSTTMRRLTDLGLGRKGFEEHDSKRPVMGYGNRMYLGRAGERFDEAPPESGLARTGWSWGVTSQDFDNDGDRDLYVANGHISGKSAQDYCSKFWRHDIYTGSSKKDGVIGQLLTAAQNPIRNCEVSWNGFEHNALLLNQGKMKFENVAYPMSVGLEEDCRAVVGDDLDGDGLMDLLVVEEKLLPGNRKYQVLHILKNELENTNQWIGVRLQESAGRSWIGAEIELTHGDHKQVRRFVTGDSFYCQHAPAVSFGLGPAPSPVTLKIRWPDGQSQTLQPSKNNHWITIR